MSQNKLNDKRTIFGWVMYDWANSAYFLVISTAVFPPYFNTITSDQVFFGREISNDVFFSYSVAAGYALIAFIVPLLSGVADYGGKRKMFLKFFTWLGGLSCIALFFFQDASQIWYGLGLFILSTIGAGAGIAFYNAYLPEIVTEDKYDQVSARGYSYGYFGSVLLLLFCLVMILKPDMFGFAGAGTPTRLAFLLVGVWWLGFAQITFRRLPADRTSRPSRIFIMLRLGFRELGKAWKQLKQHNRALRFLFAALCYMAGVQTVIYVATIFGSDVLGMETAELTITVLILQIVAIGGAFLFARLSDIRGNKLSLLIQILIWMGICVGAYFIQTDMQFYVVAAFVGLVLGGIQSLSRSTYAKFLESDSADLTSYFSFYDVMMKVSVVAGTFIFGFVQMITGDMRNSILILLGLFVVGGLILLTINMKDMKRMGG